MINIKEELDTMIAEGLTRTEAMAYLKHRIDEERTKVVKPMKIPDNIDENDDDD